MKWSRRQLLQAGAMAGLSAAGVLRQARAGAPAGAPANTAGAGKRIALHNVHTDERLEVEYYRGADYVPESLAAIQVFLRDWRNDQQHVMDPKLMDILHDVALRAGVDPAFSVISGYRSPQTNETLRERSSGVARHSLHLEGRAIDVRLAGVGCADLASRALDLARGGVGYYRQSDFVHLDTGAFRTWKG